MDEIALPHTTRPVRVLITEPLTMANRGRVARWLEDRGIGVAIPADTSTDLALIVAEARCIGPNEIACPDRLVYDGARVQAIDQAHYKLWYEPVQCMCLLTNPEPSSADPRCPIHRRTEPT